MRNCMNGEVINKWAQKKIMEESRESITDKRVMRQISFDRAPKKTAHSRVDEKVMNNIFYAESICERVRKITPEKYYRPNKYKEIFIMMLSIKKFVMENLWTRWARRGRRSGHLQKVINLIHNKLQILLFVFVLEVGRIERAKATPVRTLFFVC